MTQLFILLAQSGTGAVITIIALLLVAAIIGYFTSWFYAKSVYTPIIKGLETDNANLNKQVDGLNEDIARLKGSLEKQKEKISGLEEQIKELDKELKLRAESAK
jgi:peptidoglycan hydrolase CwlO-like protein